MTPLAFLKWLNWALSGLESPGITHGNGKKDGRSGRQPKNEGKTIKNRKKQAKPNIVEEFLKEGH